MIDISEATIASAGPGALKTVLFTPNGPAGAFGNYLLPGQTMPRVFMNEFVNVREDKNILTYQFLSAKPVYYPCRPHLGLS